MCWLGHKGHLSSKFEKKIRKKISTALMGYESDEQIFAGYAQNPLNF
jgi:hypothetical protein